MSMQAIRARLVGPTNYLAAKIVVTNTKGDIMRECYEYDDFERQATLLVEKFVAQFHHTAPPISKDVGAFKGDLFYTFTDTRLTK